jgi:hypothetical protein
VIVVTPERKYGISETHPKKAEKWMVFNVINALHLTGLLPGQTLTLNQGMAYAVHWKA